MRTSIPKALVLIAVVAAACNTGQATGIETDTTEPPAIPGDATEASTVPVDQALSTAAAYFSGFNSGDANAVMALLPSSATFSDNFTGSITRESWEQRLVWNLAQGTSLATPDCLVADAEGGEGIAVSCESATLNAQIRTVGAKPVPTAVSLLITPNGIQDVREDFGQPDFLQAIQPFMDWMEDKHTEDAGRIGFGVWDSVDQAQENGELTAGYARLWAAHLELNCIYIPDLIDPDRDSYLDDCGFIGR